MKKLILNSLLLAVVSLTACKKDDVAATKTELLTNGSWNLTAFVSDEDGNGTYEFNEFASFPSCIRDNFYTFKTNFELEVNEGATKCDPTDSQTEILLWSFSNNETVLVIDSDPEEILELNGSTLKLKVDNGLNTSSVLTFTKR